MNPQPKMTVITAAYNLLEAGREEMFRQCLESVHNQTYKNIEHIIILTPSSDGTEQLVDEYADKGWVSCHIQPKRGVWQAMAKGIEVAAGDFINFMNSDDYFYDLEAVEQIVNALVREQADYAYSNARVLSDDGSESCWYDNYDFVPFGQGLCHQTMFVSMEVMREFGGFRIEDGNSPDNYMMLELQIKNKKHAHINKSLVTFRQGGWSSQLNSLKIKEGYQNNFYNQIGKDFGLTFEECGDIWCFNAIQNKDEKYCRKLAEKIKNGEWKRTFLDKLNQKVTDEAVYYHLLFGFIPFIKQKQDRAKGRTRYYLFNFIPIWKTKISNNDTKIEYCLFQFIPILKIKIKNN
ncbi:MAG: glycosyltransferase [Candidatus Gastranaerophilaceae bacterium]